MEGTNYRKSPWRFLFLAVAILAGLWLALYGVMMAVLPLLDGIMFSLSASEIASIGVIGGADGPTSVFVATSGMDWDIIIMLVAMLIGIIGFLRLRKCKPKT